MTNEQCSKCNGSGEIVHLYKASPKHLVGHSTALCECRASLPRRFGKMSWWTDEALPDEHYEDTWLVEVTAHITREIPVSEDNYALHRTKDNQHFPPVVELDFTNAKFMAAHMVRGLATWLNKLADTMDEYDKLVEFKESKNG
jgi:hypothetical protein